MANSEQPLSPLVIAAILGLVTIGSATVIGVSLVGLNDSTTPLVTTVLGFIGTSLITLLVLVRQGKAETQLTNTTNEVKRLGNGALEAALTKHDSKPAEMLQKQQVSDIHDEVIKEEGTV